MLDTAQVLVNPMKIQNAIQLQQPVLNITHDNT